MTGFWRGPITSRKQASDIIRWTGWLFVSLAVIPIIFSFNAPRFSVYFAFVTAILSVILLWKQSQVAAWILFAIILLIAVISMLLTALVVLYELANNSYGMSEVFILGTLPWIPLALLTWRAFRATKAWPGLSHSQSPGAEETKPLGPPWIT